VTLAVMPNETAPQSRGFFVGAGYHLLALLERLEAVHLDCRKMREEILAAPVRRDESVALRVVEPLDRPSSHTRPSSIVFRVESCAARRCLDPPTTGMRPVNPTACRLSTTARAGRAFF